MAANLITVALGIAGKDLRLYARDRAALGLGFLLPIALVTVFGLVFGSMFGSDDGAMNKQTIHVADMDHSDASRRFIDALEGTGVAEVVLGSGSGSETVPYDRGAIHAGISKGKFGFSIVIDPGFESRLKAGEAPPLEIMHDPSRTIEYQMLSAPVFQALMAGTGGNLGSMMTRRLVRSMGTEAGIPEASIDFLNGVSDTFFSKLSAEFASAQPRTTSKPTSSKSTGSKASTGNPMAGGMASMLTAMGVRVTSVGGEQIDAKSRNQVASACQSVAGTAVMMLLFGLVACGSSLLVERDQGTLRRLLVTPAPREAVLLGKFFYTFAIGFAQLIVMFTYGAIVFHLPVLEHLFGMILVSVALCAAATSFGVFLAAVSRSQKQVEGFSTLIILMMSAIGGSWFPTEIMPPFMRVVGRFTLNSWAMEGYKGLFWHNLPVSEILMPIGVLLGIAVGLSAISFGLYRSRFASQAL